MPSEEVDVPAFRSVDWADASGGRPRPDARTLGLALALVGLSVLFAYDLLASPEDLFPILDWDLARVDWLFLVSIVLVVRYAAVPLFADRERSARHLREFLSRPAGALSLAYILVFGVLGLLGPETVFDFGYPRLEYRLQPPVFARVYAGDVTAYTCAGRMVEGYCHGTWRYPLGTTRIGENMVELVLYGMRIGLKLGITAGTIMAVVATGVGTAAGYYGGLVDDALMRYVDVQQTVPAIVVYIVLATLYLGNLQGVSDGGLFAFVLVFGLLDWGGIARIVRGDVLKRRSAGYVRAAKAAGASDLHVIRRHVIPNSTATIVTALTRRIPLLILAQVALAFLELNRIDSRSLGRVMRMGLSGRHMAWHRKWWVTTFGVVFLVLTAVAFNVFGDTVLDVLDPREEVE